jgi:hypothetical protein
MFGKPLTAYFWTAFWGEQLAAPRVRSGVDFMYDASLRRLLEMYPAGASCAQLLYHLRTSGTRATAADILQSLNVLSGNGEAEIVADGRWLLSRFLSTGAAGSASTVGLRGLNKPAGHDVLRAVRGHALSQSPPACGVLG